MAAISASRDGGVTGSGAATIDAEDVFVRRVTGASLGTASGRASVSMAVGALSGEAGVVSVRRALFDDGVDGVLTFSQRTTLREVVATHQRGCGLRTGTAVSNSEESARAVTTVGAESGPCLRSVVGDVSLAVIDL